MKKLLLGSTALVAAGMIAGPAFAAEKIKIGVGGYMEQWVGFASNKDVTGGSSSNGRDYAKFDEQSDTEIHFNGSTTLENGIKVSVKVELEGERSATGMDDSYIKLTSDSIGDLRVGSTKHAFMTVMHRAPDVGIGITDVEDWIPITNSAGNGLDGGGGAIFLGDANKVVYFTPRFGGFGLAASWAPDDATTGGDNIPNLSTPGIARGYSIAAVLDKDFGGALVKADLGHYRTTQDKRYTGGVNVIFGGITVGGSYMVRNMEPNTATTEGRTFDLGVAYKSGKFAVSVQYVDNKADGAVGNTASDTAKTILGSVSYNLGPGIDFKGSLFHANYQDEANAAASENSGFGLVGGMTVSF